MKVLGIDWGSQLHALALVGPDREIIEEWELEHTAEAVEDLLTRLEHEGGPNAVLVAIEPGAALLMDRLWSAGYTIYPINPKQLDRFRDRLSPSGAKDDARDALVAALAVITDRERLRALQPQDEASEELVARAAARKRLVDRRTALSNQLTATLRRFFPSMLDLKRDACDPFFLDLLQAYPDPEKAGRARGSRVERLLRSHRIRALDTADVLHILHGPAFPVRKAVQRSCRDEVIDLARQIQLLNEQIQQSEKRLAALFEEHPDRELYLSLPGMGINLAVRVGTRIGRSRFEQLDPSILRCLVGTAPVSKITGKRRRRRGAAPTYGRRIVIMRRACDRQLQADMNQWAAQSLRSSGWARSGYDDQRRRGKTHNQALRTLANKWIVILQAVITSRRPYDEDLHVRHLVEAGVPWARHLAPQPLEAA